MERKYWNLQSSSYESIHVHQHCWRIQQHVYGVNAHLRQTELFHLVELPPHSLLVPLQLPLCIPQPLQVFLVVLLLTMQLLLLLFHRLLQFQYLLLLQRVWEMQ